MENINELKYIENLNAYNKKIHKIILNKLNKIITTDGKDNYILLKMQIEKNKIISIKDIIRFNEETNYNINILKNNHENNITWKYLWKQKIDYYENYILKKENISDIEKIIINYFIGIAENAIKYIENIDINVYKKKIMHYRIEKNYTLFDLYNPFNLIFDLETRDISEYIKSNSQNKNIIEEINFVINNSNYNIDEYKILIGRLVYPSIFLDIIEKKIENSKITIDLYKEIIINERIVDYTINAIKKYKKIDIPNINWLSINQ